MKHKTIKDEVLLKLLDDFFYKECDGEPKRFKLPAVAKYINELGYDYSYQALRKNPVAVNYSRSLREEYVDEDKVILSSYKTIDVEEFLRSNNTRSKLINAITSLDMYYEKVASSALKIKDECVLLSKELKSEKNKRNELAQENKDLKDEIKALRASIAAEQETTKVLRNYIDTTINEGCAQRVLKEAGYPIDFDDCEYDGANLITADTDIVELLEKGFLS